LSGWIVKLSLRVSVRALLVPERFDRVHPRGAPGWEEAEQHPSGGIRRFKADCEAPSIDLQAPVRKNMTVHSMQ
jgi:hypothetical protein